MYVTISKETREFIPQISYDTQSLGLYITTVPIITVWHLRVCHNSYTVRVKKCLYVTVVTCTQYFCNWASEVSPTWTIYLRFFIYILLLNRTYVGVCVTPPFFFFGVRCAQYKVHALRCARPTHTLHASSINSRYLRIIGWAIERSAQRRLARQKEEGLSVVGMHVCVHACVCLWDALAWLHTYMCVFVCLCLGACVSICVNACVCCVCFL